MSMTPSTAGRDLATVSWHRTSRVGKASVAGFEPESFGWVARHGGPAIWKEWRLLFPLMLLSWGLIAVGMIVAAYSFLTQPWLISDAREVGVGLTGVLGFLYAIGFPVLLIANEHDSGTMSWHRCMPMHPRELLLRKCLVAYAGWLAIHLTIIVCGWLLILLVQFDRGSIEMAEWFGAQNGWKAHLSMHLLAVLWAGLATTFSLWFRHPVTIVLATVLSAMVGSIIYRMVLDEVQRGLGWGSIHSVMPTREAVALMAVSLISIVIAIWTYVVTSAGLLFAPSLPQRVSAWKHHEPVKDPDRGELEATSRFEVSDSAASDRQLAIPRWISVPQPKSKLASLLWQQLRTCGWPLLAIAVVAVGCMGFITLMYGTAGLTRQGSYRLATAATGISILGLAASMIGGLMFASDVKDGRYRFVGDRGWSLNWVFLSRVIPAFVVVAVLSAGLMMVIASESDAAVRTNWMGLAGLVGCLALIMGMIGGMGHSRFGFAFLLSPVVACITAYSLAPMYVRNFQSVGWMFLALPVGLLSVRRLCRPFYEGRRDRPAFMRLFLHAAAIAGSVVLATILGRWMQMPDEPDREASRQLRSSVTRSLAANPTRAWINADSVNGVFGLVPNVAPERLAKETIDFARPYVIGMSKGEIWTVQQPEAIPSWIAAVLSEPNTDWPDTRQDLLDVAKKIRDNVALGGDPSQLLVAEYVETLVAAATLTSGTPGHRHFDGPIEFADDSLVGKSRRAAITNQCLELRMYCDAPRRQRYRSYDDLYGFTRSLTTMTLEGFWSPEALTRLLVTRGTEVMRVVDQLSQTPAGLGVPESSPKTDFVSRGDIQQSILRLRDSREQFFGRLSSWVPKTAQEVSEIRYRHWLDHEALQQMANRDTLIRQIAQRELSKTTAKVR